MNRLEMRAAARAIARGATPTDARAESDRAGARRETPSLHEAAVDEELARRACAPMGALESIVVSRTTRNRRATYYVIVPDPALADEYERLGLTLEPGCRVLLDAAALRPLAVLTVIEPGAANEPSAPENSPVGFNPYFDLPGA